MGILSTVWFWLVIISLIIFIIAVWQFETKGQLNTNNATTPAWIWVLFGLSIFLLILAFILFIVWYRKQPVCKRTILPGIMTDPCTGCPVDVEYSIVPKCPPPNPCAPKCPTPCETPCPPPPCETACPKPCETACPPKCPPKPCETFTLGEAGACPLPVRKMCPPATRAVMAEPITTAVVVGPQTYATAEIAPVQPVRNVQSSQLPPAAYGRMVDISG